MFEIDVAGHCRDLSELKVLAVCSEEPGRGHLLSRVMWCKHNRNYTEEEQTQVRQRSVMISRYPDLMDLFLS